MERAARYREIEVRGTPRAMGREIGEAAHDEIQAFCEATRRSISGNPACSTDQAFQIARQSARLAAEYSPDLMEELEGTAEAAGVSLDELMLLQVRNQLPVNNPAHVDRRDFERQDFERQDFDQRDGDRQGSDLAAGGREGCTSLSLVAGSGRIVAQNWDNDPALDAFTIVLTRRPKSKPALTTCTQAGLIAYIGFNEAGIGACLNTLPAPGRPAGVPHYFTLRRIYEATSLAGAEEAVRRAERAIPANIMLSTPEGPANLEVTVDQVHTLTGDGLRRLGHTNHCLHPELAAINDQYPELIQSHARKRRVDARLAQPLEGPGLEFVKDILRDHENYPRSICRHANDDPQYGNWETVFSVIIQPESRRIHITRGTPCNREYEVYDMS